MRGVAFVALLGSLSASAATVDIPLDFGADFGLNDDYNDEEDQ